MLARIGDRRPPRPPDRAALAAVADEPEADPPEHVHGGAVIVEVNAGRDNSRMTGHATKDRTGLRRRDWMVDTLALGQAASLVAQEHYAHGGANTATFRHGLFRVEEWPLVPRGVAWWIPPTRAAAEATYPEGDWRRVLALSRFVLDPTVPQNGASFLLARSSRRIKQSGEWDCLVTYADEWQGHVGTMYLAAGWEYVGLTRPERVYTLNGRMVARKAGPRTRTHSEMLALGAECVGAFRKHKFRLLMAARSRAHHGAARVS